MWTIGIWLFALFMCLNGILAYVSGIDTVAAGGILSPFNLEQNLTATSQPDTGDINNTSGLLFGVTNGVVNGTQGSILDPFQSLTNFITGGVVTFYNLLTGQFIWNALAAFGFPDAFMTIIQGIILFWLSLSVIHLIRYGV